MSDPNVLLVVLDAVRARNCSLYGHVNETTPFLSSVADDTVTFSQARTPGIHSVASHASMFSGYEVPEHRVTRHEGQLDPSATIWSELTDDGYATGLFTSNVVVTKSSNLHEPFETCVGPRRRTTVDLFPEAFGIDSPSASDSPTEYLKDALRSDTPIRGVLNGAYAKLDPVTEHDPDAERASVYVEEFLDWMDRQDGPWAGCLNLMDAHFPYLPDPEYDHWAGSPIRAVHEQLPEAPLSETFLEGQPWGQLRALESLYDGCIRQLDSAVETLFDRLKATGEFEDTLVVVTADHGEGFGERSRVSPPVRLVDHSWGIAEELTHVPLVVKPPGEFEPRSVESPVTLSNIPAAIRAVRADSTADESATESTGESTTDRVTTAFRPDDGVVYSSTWRIESPGSELPVPEAEREPYFGPWRAIYTTEDGAVYKQATRGDRTVRLEIPSAQDRIERPPTDSRDVAAAYDELTAQSVRLEDDTAEVDDEVEDHLADLGYLR